MVDLEPASPHRGIRITNIYSDQQFTLFIAPSSIRFHRTSLKIPGEVGRIIMNATEECARKLYEMDPATRNEFLKNSVDSSIDDGGFVFLVVLPGDVRLAWVATNSSPEPNFALLMSTVKIMFIQNVNIYEPTGVGSVLQEDDEVQFTPWFYDLDLESRFWLNLFPTILPAS